MTKVHALQADGWALTPATGTAEVGVITVTSGDNSLAGPEFQVSLDAGAPFYDALALEAVGFDALCLGNHDFDFGPDVTADFIESFTASPPPFLSANLDVSAEPRLDALATSGRIARSTTVAFGDWTVGIVGATTEVLASISSPRDLVVSAVQPAVQAEIDALTAAGVEVIVLVSHLQSIEEDKEASALMSQKARETRPPAASILAVSAACDPTTSVRRVASTSCRALLSAATPSVLVASSDEVV